MNTQTSTLPVRAAALTALVMSMGSPVAGATEPCGELGECKALVEINSSDGDIGFHFLMDGDDLVRASIIDPNRRVIFFNRAFGALNEQKYTELFVESAEPLCFDPAGDDDDENDDETFVTLAEFLDRWTPGTYRFVGRGAARSEVLAGETELTFELPAAPANLAFDGSFITWDAGDDLGECASESDLEALVDNGSLPVHPEDVTVVSWEVVMEPDVEDGDITGSFKYSIRLDGDLDPMAVTVPAEYLASLPDDTPAKIEVGAIGEDDNATFTEIGDICLNEVEGCEDEDEDDDEDEDEDDDEDEDEDEDD